MRTELMEKIATYNKLAVAYGTMPIITNDGTPVMSERSDKVARLNDIVEEKVFSYPHKAKEFISQLLNVDYSDLAPGDAGYIDGIYYSIYTTEPKLLRFRIKFR